MADAKLSALPSATPATNDLLYIVDVSDTTDSAAGSSKKTTVANVLALSPPPDLSSYATTAAVAAGYQPLDSDLTAIAALSTTSFGRSLLTAADAAAARSAIGAGTGNALTSGTLAQFAATTSAELAGVLTDETGSGGGFVRATAPTLSGATANGTTTFGGRLVSTAGPFVGGVCLSTSAASNSYIDAGVAGTLFCVVSGQLRATVNQASTSSFAVNSSGGFYFSTSATDVNVNGTSLLRPAAGVVGLSNAGAGATLRSIPTTPAQITSDQNDYAPGVARYYRLSTNASRTVTGLSVSQVDGQECWVINVGSNSLILSNQNASSTAANRFLTNTGADITLAANEVAMMVYDGTSSRWRVWKE